MHYLEKSGKESTPRDENLRFSNWICFGDFSGLYFDFFGEAVGVCDVLYPCVYFGKGIDKRRLSSPTTPGVTQKIAFILLRKNER